MCFEPYARLFITLMERLGYNNRFQFSKIKLIIFCY